MRILIIFIGLFISPFIVFADSDTDVFKLTSPAFENNAPIPRKYTCSGGDINPALVFTNVPFYAKTLVLTVSDPDAPEGVWSHWVVYNMPPYTKQIDENSNPSTEGLNDFGKYAFGGPCPQDGKLHHYIFHAYALDSVLKINEAPNLAEVEAALQGHIIAETKLAGTYK